MGDADGSTRDRGRAVEQLVATFLERRGIEIVDRNFEAAGAEVDLVGRQQDRGEEVYVFVEVRSRGRDDRGEPLETITPAKQRRVIRAATAWLVARGLWEQVSVRFDVVGVLADDVEWIRGAFETA